jgi:septal ring factor EnvC (AmiA/AmiB activator)
MNYVNDDNFLKYFYFILEIDYERLLHERDEVISQLRHEQEVNIGKARRAFSEKAEKEKQLQEQVMNLTTECSQLQSEISNLSKMEINCEIILNLNRMKENFKI